jgi:hypothetical protein
MININKILLEEKNRILELHKTATKNHYLMEDTPIPTSFTLGGNVELENKLNGGNELKLFKGVTFYIARKGVLYANTQWQQVHTLTGNFSGKSSQGKDNVYYNCSTGKFSVGKEQKLPPCPTKDGKCKNLYYIENIPILTQKVSALCKLSQTFVKGKTIEKKIENNKNTEQVKSQEVKTPEVKTPVVQPVQTVQTPENEKIISDVDNYDEAALAKIAAEIQ